MRACGISIYRTALPLLVFAALASTVLFTFEERILAVTNRRAEFLRHVIRGGSAADLRRAESQVADRAERRDLSLPVSTTRRAASSTRCRCSAFDPATQGADRARLTPRKPTYAGTAGDADDLGGAKTGWMRDFAGADVTRYAPIDDQRPSRSSRPTTSSPRRRRRSA